MSLADFTIIRRQVVGHRIRTTLTIFAIGLTVAIAIAVIGLSRGLSRTIASGLDEPGADLLIAPRDSFTLVGGSVPPALAEVAARTPGVAEATPVLLHFVALDGAVNVVGWGWPVDSPLWSRATLSAGRLPRAGEKDVVLLGERTLRALGKAVGDSVEIEVKPFRIIGTARFNALLNQDAALVPLAGLQEAIGRTGSASFIQVRFERPVDLAKAESTRALLAARATGFSVTDTSSFVRDIRIVRVIGAVGDALVFLMLALVATMVANAQLMAVNERAYDFAVLSAIGWSRSRIFRVILLEGGTIAGFGTVMGFVCGIFLTAIITRALSGVADIEAHFPGLLMLAFAGTAIACGLLGAVLPGWRAMRLPVAATLRQG